MTKLDDSIIDARGMTLSWNTSVSLYGTAVNGESFETSTIMAYGGYEYTAYWVMDTSSGTSYHAALARRTDNGTTFGAWQVCNLPNGSTLMGCPAERPPTHTT